MAQDSLTQEEHNVYIEWLDRKNRASLSPALSAKMFELFLHGDTCERIVSLSPGIQLGQVLEARVRDRWDQRREKHLDELYGTIAARLKQTQLEAVEFTTDLMAAAHKEFGTKLKKYLMTGDVADLPDNAIKSLAAYSKVADVLLKLSGQNKDKTPTMPTMVTPAAAVTPEGQKALGSGGVRVDSGSANRILKFLEEQESDE